MTYDELAQLVQQRQCLELLVIWQLCGIAEPVPWELVKTITSPPGENQWAIDNSFERTLTLLAAVRPPGKLAKWAWAVLLSSAEPRIRSVGIRYSGDRELWLEDEPPKQWPPVG